MQSLKLKSDEIIERLDNPNLTSKDVENLFDCLIKIEVEVEESG